MKENGFYVVKNSYFDYINDPFLKWNKYWFIPMSSKVEKYEKIINRRKEKNKSCDILHIAKLDNNRKSVFLIQDMFPIANEYIERQYTIGKTHFRVTSEALSIEVDKKARTILALLKKGIKLTPQSHDIMKIYNMLIKNQ